MNTLSRGLCALGFLMLAACGQDAAELEQAAEGREETRTIRNTQAIGVAGDAIADKLDQSLEQVEQRQSELDQSIESSQE